MPLISDDDIARVREATDIVSVVSEYVQLKRRGRDYWGCCPFHNEKTPSFKVSGQTQTWHCFGCGQGGDVFKFLMQKEQFDFPEAVRFLADKAGITIKEERGGMPSGYRARLFAVCEETASFYHLQLMRGKSSECDKARSYLSKRGLGGQIPKKWNLGYAPGGNSLVRYLKSKGFTTKEMVDANVALVTDRGTARDRFYNRVMFPIRDLQGRTIAFGGRVIGQGEPKYINTSNCPLFSKRNNLFGIDFAKSAIVNNDTSIVVEGYTDVIAMHGAGFENTVATLGTALTPQHVKLLTRFSANVIYLFDGDAAGQHAADRAADLITTSVAPESGGRQVTLSVGTIPNNMDPAEYIASEGSDGMQKVLDAAVPLLKYVIDRKVASFDLSTPENRALALPKVLEPLVPVRDSILSDEYVNYISDIFKIEFPRVRRELDNAPVPRVYSDARDDGDYGFQNETDPSSGSDPQGTLYGGPGNGGAGSQQGGLQEANPATVSIPREGVGRWEAQLLCAYATIPGVRTRISQAMKEREWSNEVFAKVMKIMLDCGPDTSPSDMVAACMRDCPESEPIWILEIPPFKTPAEAESMVKVMLKERDKAELSDKISDLERKVKYDEGISQEQAKDMFVQISEMQKKLSELRKQ
ncbi:MAG: DNA primase [Coriobacteriales bacterium]|jgi:DNA primase